MVAFTFSTVDYQGDLTSSISGINDRGQAIGTASNGPGSPGTIFILANGQFEKLKTVPGSRYPTELNNLDIGVVATGNVVSVDLVSGGRLSTLYTFTPPYAGQLGPVAINDFGDIVGSNVSSPYGYPMSTAWIDKGGVFTTIPRDGDIVPTGINDLGQITGDYSQGEAGNKGSFLYTQGVYTGVQAPGKGFTVVGDVNNLGEVVGSYQDKTPFNSQLSPFHGFVSIDGHFQTVDFPGAGNTSTGIGGVNDFGEIFGTYIDAKGELRAFVATPKSP